ncbi:hypothetical protein CEXT_106191 [Caerostris extrusa]|uniref:Uncharacterized protein n=1 Tax=Caerostris extrusa TaxID=172846 RepID=A0AAV4PDS6_CAEEX|nr:hypothetical protein CEXT_106191 [Caerostris extrusa]
MELILARVMTVAYWQSGLSYLKIVAFDDELRKSSFLNQGAQHQMFTNLSTQTFRPARELLFLAVPHTNRKQRLKLANSCRGPWRRNEVEVAGERSTISYHGEQLLRVLRQVPVRIHEL